MQMLSYSRSVRKYPCTTTINKILISSCVAMQVFRARPRQYEHPGARLPYDSYDKSFEGKNFSQYTRLENSHHSRQKIGLYRVENSRENRSFHTITRDPARDKLSHSFMLVVSTIIVLQPQLAGGSKRFIQAIYILFILHA